MGDFGGRHVSGHEFTRAGPRVYSGHKTLNKSLFLTAVGWRAAPDFGAERLKKFKMTHYPNLQADNKSWIQFSV